MENKAYFQKIDWQQHVEAQKASGLSKSAYCRENNLSCAQFRYYVQKFKPKASVAKQGSRSDFIPLQVTSSQVPVKKFTLEHADGSKLSWSADWSTQQVLEFVQGWRVQA